MTRSASRRRIRLVSAVFVLLAGIYTAIVSDARDVIIVSSVVAFCGLVLFTQTLTGEQSAEA